MSRAIWRCILGALLFGALAFAIMLLVDLFCWDPWLPAYDTGYKHNPYRILTDPSHMLFEPTSFNRELRPFVLAYLCGADKKVLDPGQLEHEKSFYNRHYYSTLTEEQRQTLFKHERSLFCELYYVFWLQLRGHQLLYYPMIASIFGAFIALRHEHLRQQSKCRVRVQNFLPSDTAMLPNPSTQPGSAPTIISRQYPSIATTANSNNKLNSVGNTVPTEKASLINISKLMGNSLRSEDQSNSTVDET
jgi:hypothetical protein